MRCKNGHIYDETKFDSCPYCAQAQKFAKMNQRVKEEEEDVDYTIPFYEGKSRTMDLVTGWIVCVEGPTKGQDYHLGYGYSRIGRGHHMDVSVPQDEAITRDNHVSIVCDPKHNTFYLIPSSGNIAYLNSQLLTTASPLHSGDLIQIGNSLFEFVPYVTPDKGWQRYE